MIKMSKMRERCVQVRQMCVCKERERERERLEKKVCFKIKNKIIKIKILIKSYFFQISKTKEVAGW